MIPPEDVAEAEGKLRAKKEELEERLGGFTKRPEPGTNLSFGKRIGDGTTEAIDRLNQIGVGNTLVSNLEGVDRALQKIEDGTYGICDACGKEIDPRRMRARPESTVCVGCTPPPPPRG